MRNQTDIINLDCKNFNEKSIVCLIKFKKLEKNKYEFYINVCNKEIFTEYTIEKPNDKKKNKKLYYLFFLFLIFPIIILIYYLYKDYNHHRWRKLLLNET